MSSNALPLEYLRRSSLSLAVLSDWCIALESLLLVNRLSVLMKVGGAAFTVTPGRLEMMVEDSALFVLSLPVEIEETSSLDVVTIVRIKLPADLPLLAGSPRPSSRMTWPSCMPDGIDTVTR